MRKLAVPLFLLGAAVLMVALGASGVIARSQDPVQMAGSVVKVVAGSGHGSGTHIGDGFVLTATHVVHGAETVKLKMDSGAEREAEVLWTNKKYDIALLRVADDSGIGASDLVCRELHDRELVFARGNPMNIEFIETRGYVAGKARTVGPWHSVNPVNMAIAGGMSGGGIFDERGKLVGVTVGLMAMPIGFGGSAVGIGYIVPASAVCLLLGR